MENKLGKEELIVLCAITPETGTNEKIAKKIKVNSFLNLSTKRPRKTF